MAFILADRVRETTSTTGTGTVDLGGAVSGYQTFVDGIGDTNKTYYCISHRNADEWEVGVGTVTDAATDTLSRDTVLASSNSGAAVAFSSGTKDVRCVHCADRTAYFNDDNKLVVAHSGGDTMYISHNDTVNLFETTAGAFRFTGATGGDASIAAEVRGEGTGNGALRIYDQDDEEYLHAYCSAGIAYVLAAGTSPDKLVLQGCVTIKDSTNHVGINEATPDSTLHVYEDTDGSGTGIGVTIENDHATGDALLQLLRTGAKRWYVGIDADDEFFKINDAALGTSSIIVVDGTNNRLGVNVEAPERALHVSGGSGNIAFFDSSYNGAGAASFAIRNTATDSATTSERGFKFGFTDDADTVLYPAGIVAAPESNSTGSIPAYLSFQTGSTSAIYERLRISSDGVVTVDDVLAIRERSSDPAEPGSGEAIIWVSDGNEKGDAGDVLIAVNNGTSTKWGTLFDHSGGSAWS